MESTIGFLESDILPFKFRSFSLWLILVTSTFSPFSFENLNGFLMTSSNLVGDPSFRGELFVVTSFLLRFTPRFEYGSAEFSFSREFLVGLAGAELS